MSRPLASMALVVLTAAPLGAAELPAALATRLSQGVQACVDYYTDGTALSALLKHGFTPTASGAEITLVPPAVRQNVTVKTFTEGRNNIECETHANYQRHDTQKHAFNLALATVTQNGFTRLRKHHYSSKAKTIFERGSTSMFMLIRVKNNKTMIKIKERSR